jgi:hypothetical protein
MSKRIWQELYAAEGEMTFLRVFAKSGSGREDTTMEI